MNKLRRILMVLFCAALFFLLQYVWLRPPPKFTANDDEMFKTHGEGITWQRYRDNQIVQQIKAAKVTVFFAAEMPDDESERESEPRSKERESNAAVGNARLLARSSHSGMRSGTQQKPRSTHLDLGAPPAQVELEGEVTLISDEHVLRTEWATFADGKVFSDAAVQIEGSRLNLRGHDGFIYVLADGKLTLLGEVEGEAYPADHTRK